MPTETGPETPATAASGATATSGASGDDRLDDLARRALGLVRPGSRVILGIAGSPGAGKTTLAIDLARRVNALSARDGGPGAPFAAHLPMDGYHLANSTLDRLGRHDRKGAIDTFDGWGFVALLRRLRDELDHPVYAPSFDRTVEEPIAAELVVEPETRLVIVEGNYLLVDDGPWASVKGMLAEAWFCETSDAERLRRLVVRHELGGRSPEAAKAWAETVDGKNAVLIESTAPRADLIVSGVTAAVLTP
ncbi:nucleoside/nucleotide kinase family protein [Herbiconiux daphne]|uniref:Nucleoside/nucleotide kinase family protein n=1 Tax=Herbiconiux daphne TaxID=2970914 RepID=A0ABT2H3Y3_9MICO|nr:nucleoside/nucleotide kinase family protein [Herbiconiux daphne]MCS5734650.1 nucleoside/nucleotide kinase family protein [Herbiconiux daphne]